MAKFRMVIPQRLGDPDLAEVGDLAALIYAHLLVGPISTNLRGFVQAGVGQIADTVRRPSEKVVEALRELEEVGLVRLDLAHQCILLPGVAADIRGASYKTVRGWYNTWSLLPQCGLRDEYVKDLRIALEGAKEDARREFDRAFGPSEGPGVAFDLSGSMAAASPSDERERGREKEKGKPEPPPSSRRNSAPQRESSPQQAHSVVRRRPMDDALKVVDVGAIDAREHLFHLNRVRQRISPRLPPLIGEEYTRAIQGRFRLLRRDGLSPREATDLMDAVIEARAWACEQAQNDAERARRIGFLTPEITFGTGWPAALGDLTSHQAELDRRERERKEKAQRQQASAAADARDKQVAQQQAEFREKLRKGEFPALAGSPMLRAVLSDRLKKS